MTRRWGGVEGGAALEIFILYYSRSLIVRRRRRRRRLLILYLFLYVSLFYTHSPPDAGRGLN